MDGHLADDSGVGLADKVKHERTEGPLTVADDHGEVKGSQLVQLDDISLTGNKLLLVVQLVILWLTHRVP